MGFFSNFLFFRELEHFFETKVDPYLKHKLIATLSCAETL